MPPLERARVPKPIFLEIGVPGVGKVKNHCSKGTVNKFRNKCKIIQIMIAKRSLFNCLKHCIPTFSLLENIKQWEN